MPPVRTISAGTMKMPLPIMDPAMMLPAALMGAVSQVPPALSMATDALFEPDLPKLKTQVSLDAKILPNCVELSKDARRPTACWRPWTPRASSCGSRRPR